MKKKSQKKIIELETDRRKFSGALRKRNCKNAHERHHQWASEPVNAIIRNNCTFKCGILQSRNSERSQKREVKLSLELSNLSKS